jgi:hypothetical protein
MRFSLAQVQPHGIAKNKGPPALPVRLRSLALSVLSQPCRFDLFGRA